MPVEGVDGARLLAALGNVGFSIPLPVFGHVSGGFEFLGIILLTAVPFGIYDLMEAMDDVESAEAAGDCCPTAPVLTADGARRTSWTAPWGGRHRRRAGRLRHARRFRGALSWFSGLGGSAILGLILGSIALRLIEREHARAAGLAGAGPALTFVGFMHGKTVGFAHSPGVTLAHVLMAGGVPLCLWAVAGACAFGRCRSRRVRPLRHPYDACGWYMRAYGVPFTQPRRESRVTSSWLLPRLLLGNRREAAVERRIQDYATQEGDYLPHVILRCIEKANRHQVPHRFRLNGAEVVVQPGQTADAVDAEVQRQWQAARPIAGAGV